jgi:ArsR family transcriptional regulator
MKQQLNGDQFLKVLEALSNPYRLKILAVLYKERQYVSKLARQLGISRPLLYLHLQKLEDAELIKGHHEISEDGKAMKYFELIPFSLPIDESLIASVAESVTIKKKKE